MQMSMIKRMNGTALDEEFVRVYFVYTYYNSPSYT